MSTLFFYRRRLNATDELHALAIELLATYRLTELWTTEAVLIELGNGLASANRGDAARFIESAYEDPSMHVVSSDSELVQRALRLYSQRSDKQWGMTDCISFIVMGDYQITDALTADHHFEQAGFNLLMK